MNFSQVLLILIWFDLCYANASRDATVEEGAKGERLVAMVVSQINDLNFELENGILERIALVETNFGEDTGTFSPDFFGGIWKMNKKMFDATKNRATLKNMYSKIQDHLGIDWQKVEWKDLRKPLYSGLACRLFLSTITTKIPSSLDEQAILWKNHYHLGSKTTQNFEQVVTAHQGEFDCTNSVNLGIVLDSSGSIIPRDFQDSKKFITSLVKKMNIEKSNSSVSLINYSSYPIEAFSFLSNAEEIIKRVHGLPQIGQSTLTGSAIQKMVDQYEKHGNRDGSNPIIMVFTDGKSQDDVTGSAETASEKGITLFSVGMGTDYVQAELFSIANNNPNHVFTTKFSSMVDILARIGRTACNLPTSVNILQKKTGTASSTNGVYFRTPVPPNGTTIFFESEGDSTLYLSRTFQHPNEYRYDIKTKEKTIYVPPSSKENCADSKNKCPNIYLGYFPNLEVANYTILVKEGDETNKNNVIWVLFPFFIIVLVYDIIGCFRKR